eukprot:TRINITY_DN558_c0_g1_i2.p1 TRINITY_DN558_c0_g1~~TRINITY_DN558_c0_g1_i2.p1  ORF type:complete len:359 (+),score=45.82 TRINITY_DN558_c0_g1_i2:137-1213(+)
MEGTSPMDDACQTPSTTSALISCRDDAVESAAESSTFKLPPDAVTSPMLRDFTNLRRKLSSSVYDSAESGREIGAPSSIVSVVDEVESPLDEFADVALQIHAMESGTGHSSISRYRLRDTVEMIHLDSTGSLQSRRELADVYRPRTSRLEAVQRHEAAGYEYDCFHERSQYQYSASGSSYSGSDSDRDSDIAQGRAQNDTSMQKLQIIGNRSEGEADVPSEFATASAEPLMKNHSEEASTSATDVPAVPPELALIEDLRAKVDELEQKVQFLMQMKSRRLENVPEGYVVVLLPDIGYFPRFIFRKILRVSRCVKRKLSSVCLLSFLVPMIEHVEGIIGETLDMLPLLGITSESCLKLR